MADKFMRSLRALARMTNRDLAPEAFELFESLVLDPHGEDIAMAALTKYVQSSARGFPMPGELLAIIAGPQVNPKQIANETAAIMIGLIARRGYTWTDTYRYDGFETFEDALRAEVGDEAIGVLNMCGGWQRFCQQFDEGENSNARPQLRDLLETQVIRAAQRQQRLSLEAPRTASLDPVGECLAQRKAIEARTMAVNASQMPPEASKVSILDVDEEQPF